jgi:hypothetical protein
MCKPCTRSAFTELEDPDACEAQRIRSLSRYGRKARPNWHLRERSCQRTPNARAMTLLIAVCSPVCSGRFAFGAPCTFMPSTARRGVSPSTDPSSRFISLRAGSVGCASAACSAIGRDVVRIPNCRLGRGVARLDGPERMIRLSHPVPFFALELGHFRVACDTCGKATAEVWGRGDPPGMARVAAVRRFIRDGWGHEQGPHAPGGGLRGVEWFGAGLWSCPGCEAKGHG